MFLVALVRTHKKMNKLVFINAIVALKVVCSLLLYFKLLVVKIIGATIFMWDVLYYNSSYSTIYSA